MLLLPLQIIFMLLATIICCCSYVLATIPFLRKWRECGEDTCTTVERMQKARI
jgi:hypothetical protein